MTYNGGFTPMQGNRNLPLSCNVSLNVSPHSSKDEKDFLDVQLKTQLNEASPLFKKSDRMRIKQKYLESIQLSNLKEAHQTLFTPFELPFLNPR